MKKLLFILILFCSIQGFGQSATGIRGYWRLDGNSNDASGNGYNGADTNITYAQANGRLNQGALFDGSISKIVVGASSDLNFDKAQPFTISVWIKVNSFGSVDLPIFSKMLSSSPYTGYELTMLALEKQVRLLLISSFPSIYLAAKSTFVFSTNTWYNIVCTYSGNSSTSGVKFYINGISSVAISETNTLSASILTSATPQIGKRYTLGQSFNGSIDVLIIDYTEWSSVKIKNEYSRVKGFF